MKKIKQRLLRGVAIAVIFTVMALIVLAVAIIAINYEAIGKTLGSIPGIIKGAFMNFPLDWLVAGAVGATLAFISCAIFWHLINKGE